MASDIRPPGLTLLALFLGSLAVGSAANGAAFLSSASADAERAAISPELLAGYAFASTLTAVIAATGVWRVAPYARWAVIVWAATILGGYLMLEVMLWRTVGSPRRVATVLIVGGFALGGIIRYVWRETAR